MASVREILSDAIKASGLSQYKVANDAEIDRAFLNKVLAGEKPLPIEMIDKVAPVLGLDPLPLKTQRLEELYGEEEMGRIGSVLAAKAASMPGRGGTYPPTDEEIAVIKRAQAQGWTPGAVKTPDLWALPPERRRDVFDRIKGLIEVQDRITQEGQDAG